MDSQKKQKVMIAALAVAILGAGTFFWMNSKPSNTTTMQTNTGPVQRRQREDTSQANAGPERRERVTPERRTDEAPTVTRREREDSGPSTATRRSRGRDEARKEKKKELQPLG